MPGLFSRLKTWISGETLTAADLNGEFDNVIANFEPDKIDDYSVSVAQMQLTTDPGEVGSESLATSTSGELERLRFAVAEIKGTDQWYESAATNLAAITSTGATPENRIVSGATRGSSNQPLFISPDGTIDEAIIKATVTPLRVAINGTIVPFTADITLTSLPLAPSTNNTALVNDTSLTGQANSKLFGEADSVLLIDTVGTAISAKINDWAPFKINNGVDDEYFFAYVDDNSGAPQLTNAYRGWFFDDADAPVERITISNNDTITLLRATWVFVNDDGLTAQITATTPYISGEEPLGAVNGDYWLDLVNRTWKVKTGGSFVAANQTLIGMTIQDSTKCIAARSFDFSNTFDNENNIQVSVENVTQVRSHGEGSRINVYGNILRFSFDELQWTIPADLDSGVSENASTTYYLYIKDTASAVISDIAPHMRKDLRGLYHTHNPWRCVGLAHNDASSDFDVGSSIGPEEAEFRPFNTDTDTTSLGNTLVKISEVRLYIATSGPILLGINGNSTGDTYITSTDSPSTSSAEARNTYRILRNGVVICSHFNQVAITVDAGSNVPSLTHTFFPGAFHVDLTPPLGECIYELQANKPSTTNTGNYQNGTFYALKL